MRTSIYCNDQYKMIKYRFSTPKDQDGNVVNKNCHYRLRLGGISFKNDSCGKSYSDGKAKNDRKSDRCLWFLIIVSGKSK